MGRHNRPARFRLRVRLQVLDAAGNDSDFATTLDEVRSLPLPPAPLRTLSTATALSADSMRLTWSPAAGSKQTGYRIEQSSTGGRVVHGHRCRIERSHQLRGDRVECQYHLSPPASRTK